MPGSTTTRSTGGDRSEADHNGNGNNSDAMAVVSWDAVSEFASSSSSFVPRQDASTVALDHGKVLVTGGTVVEEEKKNGNASAVVTNKVALVEWNVRRSWTFPPLTTPRFGHVSVVLQGHVFVIGGADDQTTVLNSVEHFPFAPATKQPKLWSTPGQDRGLAEGRLYATAVAVPQENAILVLGGRNECFQELDTMEVGILKLHQGAFGAMSWNTLRQTLPSPRLGCAAVLLDPNTTEGYSNTTTKLFIMGGYDGRQWQTDCYMCDINMSNMETGSWNDMPPLLHPIRFGKVVTYYNFVLLTGQHTDEEESNGCLMQCFDTTQRQWIWCKRMDVALDDIALHEPHLYGFCSNGIVGCELAKLDYQMVSDSMAVAVGTVAAEDSDLIDAPTIIAMDPVAVADDQHQQNSQSHHGHQQEADTLSQQMNTSHSSMNSGIDLPNDKGVTLRSVTRIMLPSEKSFYTGQLRKKDGSWVPHGEGLEVWVDSKEGNDEVQPKNSYYKGRFVDGYRHGLGEMYLRIEDKHYFGQFQYGSWDGIGTLKLKNRGFSYFGQFVAGEMTGLGRCSYRIRKGNQQQWVQRTYAGTFLKGKANGLGAITNFGTGKIEEYREFHEEDVFQLGSHGGQVTPTNGGSAIDC